jgi:hypothetical protein
MASLPYKIRFKGKQYSSVYWGWIRSLLPTENTEKFREK